MTLQLRGFNLATLSATQFKYLCFQQCEFVLEHMLQMFLGSKRNSVTCNNFWVFDSHSFGVHRIALLCCVGSICVGMLCIAMLVFALRLIAWFCFTVPCSALLARLCICYGFAMFCIALLSIVFYCAALNCIRLHGLASLRFVMLGFAMICLNCVSLVCVELYCCALR